MKLEELEARNKSVGNFLEALVAGAFMAADKFAKETGETVERFYLLAVHELLTDFIVSGGGQYCRHLGNSPEHLRIYAWLRKISARIEEVAKGDRKMAEFIKREVAERLLRQGNQHVRAEHFSIPDMDASATTKPEREIQAISA